ncbi:sugar phosphate isomerase/epimerase family protein [Alteromonas lipotrueae]|uniref:sugar phosphate isomerase/epimerase family protein n=1 Tax=Alteromonas lipotrueae TaxID=2803814 RepID=UPI001FEBB140|nr:sugar phosphate isomerase/epimerase [Alteromonas lipotrueae]
MILRKKYISSIMMPFVLCATAMMAGCNNDSTMNTKTENTGQQMESKQLNATLNAPQISVQLWSVKDALKQDFKGTLEQVADLGFDGVEFAGDFGPYDNDPAALKNYLSSIGLAPSGAHVSAELLNNNFDEIVQFYTALGVTDLIIPWDDRAFNDDDVTEFVSELSRLSEKLAPKGMRVGFHNHAEEWASYEDTTFFDFIANNTPKSVILQQDVGWTIHADKDPIAFVKRYPGRTITTHFKSDVEEGSNLRPIIGEDGISWSAIYKATVVSGGAKWIVIEQEEYPDNLSPMEALSKSKSGFDKVISE